MTETNNYYSYAIIYVAVYVYFYYKYVTGLPLLDLILFGPVFYILLIDKGRSFMHKDNTYVLSFLIAVNTLADKIYALLLRLYPINESILVIISKYFYTISVLFILTYAAPFSLLILILSKYLSFNVLLAAILLPKALNVEKYLKK